MGLESRDPGVAYHQVGDIGKRLPDLAEDRIALMDEAGVDVPRAAASARSGGRGARGLLAFRTRRLTFKRDALPFILFVGGLTAISPLFIDMALPAFAQIGASLGASADAVAMSVSIVLIGFALGPLSYRFGHKAVLLAGFMVFTLVGFGCALCKA